MTFKKKSRDAAAASAGDIADYTQSPVFGDGWFGWCWCGAWSSVCGTCDVPISSSEATASSISSSSMTSAWPCQEEIWREEEKAAGAAAIAAACLWID